MFPSIRWHFYTILVSSDSYLGNWFFSHVALLPGRRSIGGREISWGYCWYPPGNLKLSKLKGTFEDEEFLFHLLVGYVSLSGGYISCLLWHRTSRKYLARILRAYKKNIRLRTIVDEGIGKMHTSETLFNILLPAKSCATSAICKLCRNFSQKTKTISSKKRCTLPKDNLHWAKLHQVDH